MAEETSVATAGLRGITEDRPEEDGGGVDGISGVQGSASEARTERPAEQVDIANTAPVDRERAEATQRGLVSGERGGVTGTSDV